MRLLAVAVVCAFGLAPLAGAKPAPRTHACALEDKASVALAGIARSVMSGAEEPGESINTYFFLETAGPPCGHQQISVFAPGVIACGDGDKVIVRGTYYAPDPILNWPMIDSATVTCERP